MDRVEYGTENIYIFSLCMSLNAGSAFGGSGRRTALILVLPEGELQILPLSHMKGKRKAAAADCR